jgi:5-formyltetrahydrofolate cyclo-ligase
VNKSKLRRKILKLRKVNFNKDLKINPRKFFSILKKKKINIKYIGGYYPCNYEIDSLEILNFLRKKKFNISLPIIKKKNQMDFFKWCIKDPLKINKYGIVETTFSHKVYPNLLLVPLVAFDRQLNRLGYGGGFYDRYLNKFKNVKKIGLAFSYQELKKVPVNQYDKKLDLIITEKEIIS